MSKTDKTENIVPRSLVGTTFDAMERKTGATIGPKLATVAPMYIQNVDVPRAKNILPNACELAPT